MHTIKVIRSLLRCVCFCTASAYNTAGLAAFFKRKGYHIKHSRDVLHVSNLKKPGDIFFFSHGVFVCWGFKKGFEEKILEYVKDYSNMPLLSIEVDNFYYRYGEENTIDTHERLRLDIITLDSQDPQIKLAISYGLAQSVKLQAFEDAIQQAIRKNSYLPEEMTQRGVISLSRRALFKRIGEIFIARSSINLNSEYLDTPEVFWRNPNLEPAYIMTKKFLDIPTRVMALNQKLDVLQELLYILSSQVQHRHSTLLESIIILLIALEIIISLFQLHVW